MHIMTQSAADDTAAENARRDIDRYIFEMSHLSSNDGQLLSLGQQASSNVRAAAAHEMETPLLTNEF
jgi:hypothetical protein